MVHFVVYAVTIIICWVWVTMELMNVSILVLMDILPLLIRLIHWHLHVWHVVRIVINVWMLPIVRFVLVTTIDILQKISTMLPTWHASIIVQLVMPTLQLSVELDYAHYAVPTVLLVLILPHAQNASHQITSFLTVYVHHLTAWIVWIAVNHQIFVMNVRLVISFTTMVVLHTVLMVIMATRQLVNVSNVWRIVCCVLIVRVVCSVFRIIFSMMWRVLAKIRAIYNLEQLEICQDLLAMLRKLWQLPMLLPAQDRLPLEH